jgi:hypothetical protein
VRELPSSGALGAVRARQLLTESAGLRQVGRRSAALWSALVVFGLVAVVDAPLSALGSLAGALWWFVAAPAAFAVVARCSARQAHRRGLEGRARWRLTALSAASFAACWLLCFYMAAKHLPVGLGWAIIVGAGYLAWSWYARSLPGAAVAVAVVAVGAALALSPAPGWTVQLGAGTVMILGGLVMRYGPQAS